MNFKPPCSTGKQIGLIVVGSISLAHILFAGFWMIAAPFHRLPAADRGLAAQIGLIVRMDLALPRQHRALAVMAASSPNLLITRSATAPSFSQIAPPNALLETISEDINVPEAEIIAEPPEPRGHGAGPGGARSTMRVAVRVEPDEWLTFVVFQRDHQGFINAYSFPVAVILMIGLPLAAISLWAARRVTAPLARLAEATARLSPAGLEASIPEEGTDEIRQVARGFNTILARLHKFVADRTGMLAAISHDLRTPLTRLRLRTELLEDGAMRAKML
jgi:HAMP domain-containing protein